jgi:hypothetical protein
MLRWWKSAWARPLDRAALIGFVLVLLGSICVAGIAAAALNNYVTYRDNMVQMYESLEDRLSEPLSQRDREILQGWQQSIPQRLAILDAGGSEAWRQGAEFRLEQINFVGNRWEGKNEYALASVEEFALRSHFNKGLAPEEPPGRNGFGILERVAAWAGMLLLLPALLIGAASVPVSDSGLKPPGVWLGIFLRLTLILFASWLVVLGLSSLLWGVGSITYPVAQGLVYKPLWGDFPEWVEILPRWQYILGRGAIALLTALTVSVCAQAAVLIVRNKVAGATGLALLLSGWYFGLPRFKMILGSEWLAEGLYFWGLLTHVDPGLPGRPGLRTILLPIHALTRVPIWLLAGGFIVLLLWRRRVSKPNGKVGAPLT